MFIDYIQAIIIKYIKMVKATSNWDNSRLQIADQYKNHTNEML